MNENKTFDPVSYIFGRTQFFIEVYAASNGLSQDELTAGLATLLFASQSGKVLGTVDNLSTLRRPSAKVDSSTRKVAVARNSHRRTQVKKGVPREKAFTRETALEVLRDQTGPKAIVDIAIEMRRRNRKISTLDAAKQAVQKLRKAGKLQVTIDGKVSLRKEGEQNG